MNADTNDAKERLEGMLRRWGAAEAARRHAGAEPLIPSRGMGRAVWAIMRYSALAAAVLIAISLGVLLARQALRPGGPTAPPEAARKEVDRLKQALTGVRAEIAGLKEQLSGARNDLGAAGAELAVEARARRDAEEQLDRARSELAGSKSDGAETRRRLTAAEKALGDSQVLLKKFAGELKETQKVTAGLQKLLDASRKEGQQVLARLAAVTAEQARQRRAHEQALAAGVETQKALAEMKARQGALLATFVRLYATAGEAGRQGWRDRQQAVRARRMIERCAVLRAQAGAEPASRVVDKLEVMLTRLALLDTRDAGAIESFAALVDGSGVLAEMDRALISATGAAEMQAWLLEARLILTGAERAG